MIIQLEPNILGCGVKEASLQKPKEESLQAKLVEVMAFQSSYFKS